MSDHVSRSTFTELQQLVTIVVVVVVVIDATSSSHAAQHRVRRFHRVKSWYLLPSSLPGDRRFAWLWYRRLAVVVIVVIVVVVVAVVVVVVAVVVSGDDWATWTNFDRWMDTWAKCYGLANSIFNEWSRLSWIRLAGSDDNESLNRTQAKTNCSTRNCRVSYSKRHFRHWSFLLLLLTLLAQAFPTPFLVSLFLSWPFSSLPLNLYLFSPLSHSLPRSPRPFALSPIIHYRALLRRTFCLSELLVILQL